MLSRRTFNLAVPSACVVIAFPGCSQQSEKKWRIGYLRRGAAPLPAEFWDAMRPLGWIEGKNVEIVTRLAENRPEVMALAADLAQAKVDLILVLGVGPAGAARAASSSIPIVFSIGEDPVAWGLVPSLSYPGGNVTGFAIANYDGKLLEILTELMPALPLVAYPAFDSNPAVERAARALGVRVQGIRMASVDIATNVAPFFAQARKAGAGAIMVPEHPAFIAQLAAFAIEATKSGLPSIAYSRLFTDAGGLIAYGPNRAREFQTLAAMIDKIFKGARPGELPIELPAKFDLVINLKTAKALSIPIPKLLMLRATEVIQ